MQLGVIGLGTMGANLARNAARNGATVAVFNRTTEKTDAFMKIYGKEGTFVACHALKDLVKALTPPRAILVMVKAGEAVDAMIEELSAPSSQLSAGDILIDGGNSHYRDTETREKNLSEKGIHFIGMGVSGGEEGALKGPSMMPGGDTKAYRHLEPLLKKMAASDGLGGKCVSYIGPGGSGHFVKMVHNGIEYGLMQILAEAYHLLKIAGKFSHAEIADIFAEWGRGEDLGSFLVEVGERVLRAKDPETGNDLLDLVKDSAGQKGTGKWTTEAALANGVSVPTITAAVDARIQSSAKDFRMQRSKEWKLSLGEPSITAEDLPVKVRHAVECAWITTYAEGLQVLSVASTAEKWNLNVSDICRIWRGGCIIRSKIVECYQLVCGGDKQAALSLRARAEGEAQKNWREVAAFGALRAIPLPAITASLSSLDAYSSAWLPQGFTALQRDFFGAHGYERMDKPGMFHTDWST